jgi:hypothetical protein
MKYGPILLLIFSTDMTFFFFNIVSTL